MNKFLYLFIFFLSTSFLYSQSTVNIQINHLLDGLPFENGKNIQNDLGNDYKVNRLQYYISNFSIVHDGGQVIEVDDLYVLVDLMEDASPTTIHLGNYNITSVEAVNFYFGLDEEVNHADPSSWDMDHPLAPKFPSMHWGWTAGYRFLVLEGLSGPSIDQQLQFHVVGDEFFNQLEFPVTLSGQEDYTIEIDAEYNNLVKGLDISEGVIIHGSTGLIKGVTGNFNTTVFSTANSSSIQDAEKVYAFNIYPNPGTAGNFQFDIDVALDQYIIKLYNSHGRQIKTLQKEQLHYINNLSTGIYFFTLVDTNGATIATRKVVIQ